ncbi:NACHT, LRR and PYD domains-containing protein 1 homolog [Triplophysa dalaica]|uniref:NACHT, LRR and PYD domains-containing protein 1 homolog n=1 Tax=Triplophysa dalaica TaxID=1582913 RepID=UPI0024E03757|nr:NACHT, LRR and PYD domains-containing protein 1 homolog [Triplophysa dalaica]
MMDCVCKADAKQIVNVELSADTESHITAPVLTSNIITGNINIIHNASGITEYHPDSGQIQPSGINTVIHQYKRQICTEYQHVMEYNSLPGEHVLLCQRYIEPLIIRRYRDRKEREKEICSRGESFQDVLSSRSSNESVLNSLFDPDGRGITPGAVILQGNSGNGKSFAVQKIMLDWASGNLYRKEFEIVFHLKCKEINCIPDTKSLVELLSWSCGLTSHQISLMLQKSPERVMFIIDGFDELRLTEEIYSMTPPTDPHQRCSPELILCALLKGHVQPQSFLLVTTRSTATDTLTKMLKTPYSFTEIMGFSERGVEEYFQKFFQDGELFRKAYKFVKANETLFTACSIPVICWIICTVIRERFHDGSDVISGLETTTSIYVDFVFTLLENHCQGLNESVPTLLKSLGRLAERGMMKQQVMFDAQTVYRLVRDAAHSPFLCKFLFKKRICQETVFSFMHLSFQEFFTALYYLILDKDRSTRKLTKICSHNENPSYYSPPRFADVVKYAFGLLNKDLRCTLRKHGVFVHRTTVSLLKTWLLNEIKYGLADRSPFFLNCLYELHEKSFVEEAMNVWDKIDVYGAFLRRTDCWALVYCAQCCHSIKEIILVDCRLTAEKLSMILPALHKFEKLWLTPEDPTDSDLVDLMCALTETQTLSSQCVDVEPRTYGDSDGGIWSVHSLQLSISDELSSIRLQFPWYRKSCAARSLCFTLPRSEPIDWTNLFQILQQIDLDALTSVIYSLSKLKKVELSVDCLNESLSVWTLSVSKNCSSLTELKIDAYYLLEEGIKILRRSHTKPNCILTYKGLRCKKKSHKCTLYQERELNCNQMVTVHVDCQGFSEETLRKPLFWD